MLGKMLVWWRTARSHSGRSLAAVWYCVWWVSNEVGDLELERIGGIERVPVLVGPVVSNISHLVFIVMTA
jgi:hypothetical protein